MRSRILRGLWDTSRFPVLVDSSEHAGSTIRSLKINVKRHLLLLTLTLLLPAGKSHLFARLIPDPDSYEIEVEHGDYEELSFTLRNSSFAGLEWSAWFQTDSYDGSELEFAPSDIVDTLTVPYGNCSGLVWHNGLIWGVAHYNNYIYAVDPATNQIVKRFQTHHNPQGIAWVNGRLWVGHWGYEWVHVYDYEGREIERLELPVKISGITRVNNETIAVTLADEKKFQFISIEELEEIETIAYSEQTDNNWVGSIQWRGIGDFGQLWATGREEVFCFEVNEDFELSGQSVLPVQNLNRFSGVTYDGQFLWTGGVRPYLYQIEDTTPDFNWISISPMDGQLAGQRSEEIDLLLDGRHVSAGEYCMDIVFGNDRNNQLAYLPISFNVAGVPEINVWWEGGEDEDEINLGMNYDEMYDGGVYSMSFEIGNHGSMPLDIEAITIDNDDVSFHPSSGMVLPDDIMKVHLQFTPDQDDEFREVVLIESNDPDNEELEIDFYAKVDAAPSIYLEIGSLEAELYRRDRMGSEFSIANFGESDLTWRLLKFRPVDFSVPHDYSLPFKREIPLEDDLRRDDLGDLVEEVTVPYEDNRGLVWDGELLWGIDADRARLYAYDMTMNGLRYDFPTIDNPSAITLVGKNLYIASSSSDLIRIVDLKGDLIDDIIIPIEGIVGMTLQHDHTLIVNSEVTQSLHLLSADDGAYIDEIEYMEELDDDEIFSIAWVPEHEDGNLWALSDDNLYQLYYSPEDGLELVTEVESPSDSGSVGLTHDLEHLWMGIDGEATLIRLEDEIDEMPWLHVGPEEGVLESEDDIEINISLDATARTFGNSEVSLMFISNDPVNPVIEFPVSMKIIDAPEMQYSWGAGDTSRTVNFNHYLDQVYAGKAFNLPVTITNTGTSGLEVIDISCRSAYYSVSNSDLTIATGDSATFWVEFFSPVKGDFVGRLRIETNDPKQERTFLNLRSSAIGPPEIILDIVTEETDLLPGQSEETLLTINNEGEAKLEWSASTRWIPRPGALSNEQHQSETSESDLRRDPVGNIVDFYDSPYSEISGLVWLDDLMWGVCQSENRLFAFDPETGETVADYQIHESPTGMCTVDGELWIGSSQQFILYRYNTDGEELGTYDFINGAIGGLANVDDDYLIVKFLQENSLYVYDLSYMEQVTRFSLSETLDRRAITSMDWVHVHDEGQLWLLALGSIFQVDLDENWRPTLINEFECVADHPYNGLAHDMDNLWYSSWEDETLYLVDDGVNEIYWLNVYPEQGQVESFDWEDAIIEFTTVNIEQGTHNAELVLRTNDPEHSVMVIEFEIQVHDEPVYFIPNVTDYAHTIEVHELLFNGDRVRTGWEIGSYTENGIIAGSGVWNSAFDEPTVFLVYGDDPETERVEGFIDEEIIQFAFWDDDEELEIREVPDSLDFFVDLLEGDDTWQDGGFTAVDIEIHSHVDVPEQIEPPSEFYINSAYPNPFNSTVRIDYGLPQSQPVSFLIYDINGRLVEKKISAIISAGHHTYTWYADKVPSGVYFLAMVSPQNRNIQKVLLVR